jgi:threonine synthase
MTITMSDFHEAIANVRLNIRQRQERAYREMLAKSDSLDARMEVFEYITDREVGDTPLIRARNVERELGIRQLFLKFEGGNPTGTQKDRIAFAQCADALRRGFDAICLATCGNYGAACALAASYAGLKCFIHIPASYHTRRAAGMKELGAQIIPTPGDYEEAVELSRRHAKENGWYDANPGGDNTLLQLKAYGEIAHEIYDELRDAPKIVASPVSNGTVLAGLYKGFASLYRRGKTSRIPMLVAGSAYKKNPIVHAFVNGTENCEDLARRKIKETEINEPLINWHSFDGDIALKAIRETHGWARDVTDKSMSDLSRLLKNVEGLNALPAATAGLAALLATPDEALLQNDRFVAIITARK